MKTSTQVVVIGGGVIGCSVLYHLTKLGWKDVVLVERDELTCGSSWHAAGGFHTLNGDFNIAQLQSYTINLYKELEEISGQSCSLHLTGGAMLADTPERLDFFKQAQGRSRYLDMDLELISVAEAKSMFPLIDEKYFLGALWDAADGHLDPSGTTHAYAKAARINGAEIYRKTKVEELVQTVDGTWDVITNQGTIRAEHVVNAGGLWAREVGRMVGIELPILAMQHHYLLTEDVPEIVEYNESSGKELIHVLDFGGEIYTRQEGKGVLLGTYEQDCRPWSPYVTPWDFGNELLEPDLDRITPELEVGFEHFPPLKNVGIRKVINGPFTFAADGNPLIGPIRGLQNFWVACGVMAGFSQGGGVGLTLASWMIDGDPGYDIWGMDVARYGDWATLAYTNEKVQENYRRRFRIRFPNEELPAARPHLTTPLYDTLLAKGAVMGDNWGLEAPIWYATEGMEAKDVFSFHRSNDFKPVGEECRAVRESIGISEISNFAKYEIKGEGAELYLSKLMTNKMPKTGRMILTPMLNEKGKLIGDFTIAKIADDHFYMWGSSQAEDYHMRWFERHIPADQQISVRAINLDWVGLSIAGPNARKVLDKITDVEVSNEVFGFMNIRRMDIATAPSVINRISFTGDLGYEIWMKPEYQRRVYEGLLSAGAEFDIRHFGVRALLSLRLEKNFGTWAREYRPTYGPYEADLGRFVKLDKNDFIGREQAAEEQNQGPKRKRCSFIIDADTADAIGDEPIWDGDKVIGWVTSGGYAHFIEKSMAQGYIPVENSTNTNEGAFEIEILGKKCKATLITQPLFDPTGERMRS